MSRLLTHPWFEAEFLGAARETPHSTRLDCERDDACPIVGPMPHISRTFRRQGVQLRGAQGLFLYCPCRFGQNAGAHGLNVFFENPIGAPPAPDGIVGRDSSGRPVRWRLVSGTGLHDLTLEPSIAVGRPECWHGFITNGQVI